MLGDGRLDPLELLPAEFCGQRQDGQRWVKQPGRELPSGLAPCRDLIETYYLGRSVAEVAQLLNIPEGTVQSRTYYGLRQLKLLLSAASGEQAA